MAVSCIKAKNGFNNSHHILQFKSSLIMKNILLRIEIFSLNWTKNRKAEGQDSEDELSKSLFIRKIFWHI